MSIRKTPDINAVRKLHYSLSPKKSLPNEIVFRSAYGTAIPVSPNTGYYKFRTPANGHIQLDVSDYADDYMSGSVDKSMVKQLARTWMSYAKMYLEKRGYSVSFRIVPRWTTRSDYGYDIDRQRELRAEIWQNFLDPRNFGRRLEDYIGLKIEPQKLFIDYGTKTE